MGVYNPKGTKNLTEARMATTTSFLPVYHHKAKSSHNSSGEPETNKIRARATPFKHTQLTHSLGLRLLASTCHQLRRSPITTPFPRSFGVGLAPSSSRPTTGRQSDCLTLMKYQHGGCLSTLWTISNRTEYKASRGFPLKNNHNTYTTSQHLGISS